MCPLHGDPRAPVMRRGHGPLMLSDVSPPSVTETARGAAAVPPDRRRMS